MEKKKGFKEVLALDTIQLKSNKTSIKIGRRNSKMIKKKKFSKFTRAGIQKIGKRSNQMFRIEEEAEFELKEDSNKNEKTKYQDFNLNISEKIHNDVNITIKKNKIKTRKKNKNKMSSFV